MVDLWPLFLARRRGRRPAHLPAPGHPLDQRRPRAGGRRGGRADQALPLVRRAGQARTRSYSTLEVPFTRYGDLHSRLREAEKKRFKPEALTGLRVLNADGAPYEDDAGSPIVLLGDSFTGVYQLTDCEHAGVSAHLARALGYPVDLVMSYGGGPNVRHKLMRRGTEELKTKRLVVWMMTARDLYNYWEDWEPLAAAQVMRAGLASLLLLAAGAAAGLPAAAASRRPVPPWGRCSRWRSRAAGWRAEDGRPDPGRAGPAGRSAAVAALRRGERPAEVFRQALFEQGRFRREIDQPAGPLHVAAGGAARAARDLRGPGQPLPGAGRGGRACRPTACWCPGHFFVRVRDGAGPAGQRRAAAPGRADARQLVPEQIRRARRRPAARRPVGLPAPAHHRPRWPPCCASTWPTSCASAAARRRRWPATGGRRPTFPPLPRPTPASAWCEHMLGRLDEARRAYRTARRCSRAAGAGAQPGRARGRDGKRQIKL